MGRPTGEAKREETAIIMRTIPFRWNELEMAFERNAPDTESFVDVRTGEVIVIVDGQPEAGELRTRVVAGGEQYVKIEPASSREQYKWMEQFVAMVDDPALRERLLISIDGKGAFRRFKDVLLNYPAERERWFNYRADLLHWQMQQWMEREQLEPAEAPPWGTVEQPAKPDVVLERPSTASGEGPGEQPTWLRSLDQRQARDAR